MAGFEQEIHRIPLAGKPPSGSEDRLGHAHKFLDRHTLPSSEGLLSIPSEDIGDSLPEPSLDEDVGVYEAEAKMIG